MPVTHDQVLVFVQKNGPCLPNQIRQALQAQDNFVVGAILSELVGAGKLKFTDLSLGTSKFYYDPAQPQSLEKVSQHLGEKDQRAFTLLQNARVLRHRELEPLMRVAMSMIKDYSRAVRYPSPDGEELFWRYYLLGEDEALSLIRDTFFPAPKQITPAEIKPVEIKPIEIKSVQEVPGIPVQATLVESHVEKSKATTKKVAASKDKEKSEKIDKSDKPEKTLSQGEFSQKLLSFFSEKQIVVVQMIKSSKTEYSAIINVPSSVGTVHYFCKAKAKKSCTDGDLAAASLEAQELKLPLLFVSGGTISKKARDVLSTQLKGVVVVEPWA